MVNISFSISMRRALTGMFSAALLTSTLSGCQSTPLADDCYVKPESGRCRAAIERYYFDPQWQECRAFIWGGCAGVVPFESLQSCQSTCPSLSDEHPNDAFTDATGKPVSDGPMSKERQKLDD